MKRILSVIVLVAALVTPAYAATIVDTGPGSTSIANYTLGAASIGDQNVWLAGEFTTTQEYTITDVQGYLTPLAYTADPLTAVIYTNSNNLPGSALFSQSFSADSAGATNWYGPSGLSWDLQSGTYWVAVETQNNSDFYGGMPGVDSQHALSAYAIAMNPTNQYQSSGEEVAFRVYGNPTSAVPEPATMLLLGFGLVGVVGVRRRFKK
jgi:PEP-CTERM motif